MSHACHRFWKCYKTLTSCSLLTSQSIPCACHAKRRFKGQKWRVHVVFCRFWLGNVLRATTACTFSTSQLLKVLRSWNVLYISTSKSAPGLRCFVHFGLEMCFAQQRRAIFNLSSGQLAPHPPRAYFSTLRSHKSLEKHSVSRLFLPFRAPGIFFLLTLSLFDLLSSSLLFSDSSHLCFSSVHIIGNFDF